MGFGKKLGFIVLCALWVGCASGSTGGGDDDAGAYDASGGGVSDAAAIPDAGAPLTTCEACTANHQCPDGFVCATIGDDKACVEGCSESEPECPDGFMCGGIKMTFCAPVDGLCCIDNDDDTFGTGIDCAGPDCNDDNPDINPDADDICNGEDDDCNPGTDDGSTDPLTGQDCDGDDTDLCEEGLTYCDAATILCDDTTDDILDFCDGVDNDCNTGTLDGFDDPAFGTACDSPGDPDLCFDDQNICNSIAGMIECQDLAGGAVDLCNGLDDDCNAATPDGDGDPLVGVACDGPDTDLCEEGTTSCTGGAVVCGDLTGDNLDICNGLDDDCNLGTLDGVDDPDVGMMCDGSDTDLCEEGVTICSVGIKLCTDSSGDSVEICNGLDDDCDGTPDDLVPDIVCPGQHPGAGAVTSWGCSGMCEVLSCSAGFADIDSLVTNGCECGGMDSHAKSCATAFANTVSLGATVDISGKLDSATDSDWIRFTFSQRAAPGTWHPSVQMTDDGGGQFRMDVRTDACTSAVPTCPDDDGNVITHWEGTWDYTSGAGCCSDLTSRVTSIRVRVYRRFGDAPTCASYTLQATNP